MATRQAFGPSGVNLRAMRYDDMQAWANTTAGTILAVGGTGLVGGGMTMLAVAARGTGARPPGLDRMAGLLLCGSGGVLVLAAALVLSLAAAGRDGPGRARLEFLALILVAGLMMCTAWSLSVVTGGTGGTGGD